MSNYELIGKIAPDFLDLNAVCFLILNFHQPLLEFSFLSIGN